ncbi:hypothetical protein PM082_009949 [Marasmius tenuissimus]|nr:hypothetical protein PM082_009949 [Marasmius tenuissimus]
MKLTLSGSYLNCSYTDDTGRVIYKVKTDNTFPGGKTNILGLLPDDIPRRESIGDIREDRFAYLARIEWKTIYSTFMLGGEAVDANKFFRKEIWKRMNRIFTGGDGQEYRWIIRWLAPELVINDEVRTPVAKYHRSGKSGGKKQQGVLEIFPEGEHIIDLIVITFIYVETLRREG